MFKKIITKKGFTLLEILLVVGIIAVLAGIVIIAINPSKQLATVRNTQRKSNLAEINKAVQQYYIDNSTYPGGTSLVSTLTEICNTGAIPATTTSVTGAPCGTLTNLSDLVPTYLVAIPVDPQGSPVALLTNVAHAADTLGTGYQIMKDANNKIALNSLGAEQGAMITLGPVVVASAPTIPTNGLISYWSFDGNANDIVGSYNGVVTGATLATGTKGIKDTAYSFNGASNYILTNSNFPNFDKEMTFSWWIKPDVGTLDDREFIGFFDGSTYGYLFRVTPDTGKKLNIYIPAVGLYGASDSDVTEGEWQQLVVTVKNGLLTFYRNGNYDGSLSGTDGQIAQLSTTLNIGYRKGGYYYYSGLMDEVRIYNRALTGQEINTIYNIEKP